MLSDLKATQPNLLAVFLICAIEEGVAYGRLQVTKSLCDSEALTGVAGVLFARALNRLRGRTPNLPLLLSVFSLFFLATLVSLIGI